MPITPGTKLGPYEITAPIGAGGMGEVFRARDTKLDRDVAIKVLPDELAQDKERVARFEREAKLLASLNHPNIASIYGFESGALVLELVEGPTLAERIAKGPIPVDEALPNARQIAEALEAGHEAGVIHRDLKPANIKFKDDGTVKVLDYGLAKALEGDAPAGADSQLSQSPTLTRQGTQIGVILGTAAYMSPEQAKGKRVDKRTDIWAFGAVVYEMLTARKLFSGEDVSETLASVIKSDPDWSQLPSDVPPYLRALLRRCTAKDPSRRLRDIGDARLEMTEHASRDPEGVSPPLAEKKRVSPYVAAMVGALLAGILAWSLKPTSPRREGDAVTRLSVNLPREQQLELGVAREAPPFAIAPDGRTIVYVASEADVRHLYVRSLESDASERLDRTEGALSPFFSPNGEWVGFFSQNQLWKVSLENRLPISICEVAGTPVSATWIEDNSIVFTSGEKTGLDRVSADGGEPSPLTTVDEAARELGHLLPVAAGSSVLYSIRRDTAIGFAVGSVDLRTGASKVLVEGVRSAVPVSSGHIVYADGTNLNAVGYDADRRELTGSAMPILSGVHRSPGGGAGFFAVSASGALVYASTPASQIVWANRNGAIQPLRDVDWGSSGFLRLSPDGSKLAHSGGGSFIRDLERGTTQRLTEFGYFPVWRPGSDELAIFMMHDGLEQLFSLKADGSGEPSRLLKGAQTQRPSSWAPDGRALLFTELHPDTGYDLWILHADGTSSPYLVTRAHEQEARFSPDGRYVAYESNESGLLEVYVRDYPGGERKWVISSGGGRNVVWAPEGDELFYRSGKQLMAVEIDLDPTFRTSGPMALFEAPTGRGYSTFDVAPGGERFIMVRADAAALRELHVVLNWTEELKRLVPTEN